MKKLQLLLLFHAVLLYAMLVTGCASSSSANSFPAESTRQAYSIRHGEVVGTKAVEIEGRATIVGRLGGALIGRAIGMGNSSGFDDERRIQRAVGAVGGSVAGEAIERGIRTRPGLEVLVRLDDQETIAVVQDDDIEFIEGQRVRVLIGNDGSTRVQPL